MKNSILFILVISLLSIFVSSCGTSKKYSERKHTKRSREYSPNKHISRNHSPLVELEEIQTAFVHNDLNNDRRIQPGELVGLGKDVFLKGKGGIVLIDPLHKNQYFTVRVIDTKTEKIVYEYKYKHYERIIKQFPLKSYKSGTYVFRATPEKFGGILEVLFIID